MGSDRGDIMGRSARILDTIDRVLRPQRNVDDIVHHPGQYECTIAGSAWYENWADGTISDHEAQERADQITHYVIMAATEYLGDPTIRFCWRCRDMWPDKHWSKVPGDDVCADCRAAINGFRDMADGWYVDEVEGVDYEARWYVLPADPDGVDGLSMTALDAVVGVDYMARTKHAI